MAGDGKIFVAVDSAAFEYDGDMIVVHKGVTRVREGHPMLKEHQELFKPIDVHYDIEQATRAPGERRTLRGRGKAKDDAEQAGPDADPNTTAEGDQADDKS